jgi:hypothetical protein
MVLQRRTPTGKPWGKGKDNVSRLTFPCGYVRYLGPAHPFGWRTEHQAIALQHEKAPLICADEVGIGATLEVMRHGPGSLIHRVSAKIGEVSVECVLEFLGASTGGIL